VIAAFHPFSNGLSMALRNFQRRVFGPPTEPISINWRRGLFRIWLLISAGWVMGWTIYLIMYGLQGGYTGNRDFVAIPILLLAPPVALFIFGLATGWAFQGFRSEDDEQSLMSGGKRAHSAPGERHGDGADRDS
jgi:hypothetical protein